jgi:NAD+ diphosphatase
MIKTAFATPLNFISALRPEGQGDEVWYLFSGNQLLVNCDENRLPQNRPFSLIRECYLGIHNDKHLFAGEIEAHEEAPKGWRWSELRALYGLLDEEKFSIAGRALQLIHWDGTNKYCGRCGIETIHRIHERCRECPSCGHLSYPKLAPVIMALVRRGSDILLARGPHFPENMYSVLAGFVDLGETLEQCVAREVFEEVGLKIKNINYFGSQTWPFSHSLMIAFL